MNELGCGGKLPRMSEHEERGWLAAVAAGDRSALRRLYERYHPLLLRFIEASLKDPVEAADVAQETFISVWRQAGRFEARSSVKTWIFSIGRNKAVDRLRGAHRRQPLPERTELPDPDADVAGLIEAASDARRVRDCVEKLSPAHRRAIQLAFYDDLNYAEISQIEQAAEGTIKTRIFHAKRLLRHCLGEGLRPA
jgi:RNA polymerase sigma-70 factor (ECF subfamily)